MLLAEQPKEEPLVIKGPYNVYLRDQNVTYFTLLGKIRPEHKDNIDWDGMCLIIIYTCISMNCFYEV